MKASRQDTNPSAVLVAPHSSLSTKLKEHPRLLSVYVSMQLWSWEEFSDPAIPNLPVPISVNKARQHCYTQHWKEEWSWYCTMPILTDNINLHRDQITGGGGLLELVTGYTANAILLCLIIYLKCACCLFIDQVPPRRSLKIYGALGWHATKQHKSQESWG